MEDLPLGRIAALVPEFIVKDLPWQNTDDLVHFFSETIYSRGLTFLQIDSINLILVPSFSLSAILAIKYIIRNGKVTMFSLTSLLIKVT